MEEDIQLIVMYTIYSMYGYACTTGGFASVGTSLENQLEWMRSDYIRICIV